MVKNMLTGGGKTAASKKGGYMKAKVIAIVLAALAASAPAAFAEETKAISFGLISDTHVSDKGDQSQVISLNASPRYFTGGLAKIEAFSKAMNDSKAAFIAELGDFADNPVNASLSADKKRAAALAFLEAGEAKLALFKGPRYHVFGNHDTDQASKADVQAILVNTSIPAGQTYYSFTKSNVHFIVLDASFKADGTTYAASNYTWDDANVPASELAWLKADLAANALPTVVLTHQLINPMEQVDANYDPSHSAKNAGAVRSILEASGKVVAVFSGHYHDGGFQTVNGISYVVLQANAAYGNDASYHNQYATVDVFTDGSAVKVVVAGNGMQKSYVIKTTLK